MKILNLRIKESKAMLIAMVFTLLFSPYVKAQSVDVASLKESSVQNEGLTESGELSDAIATEDMQGGDGSGEGGMAMGGEWEKYPPPAPPPASPSGIGGVFSSLMGESFRVDLATGTASLSIPIVVPPGRKNIQPNIALSYSSNSSNGICGVGWSIPIMAIQRSTKKGVPRYDVMADFVAGGEELVTIGYDEYRAKLETSFTKYLYEAMNNKWLAFDKSGTIYHFGSTEATRLTHPNNPDYVFAWFLDEAVDTYGNAIKYFYEKDDNYVYIKYIQYTSNFLCNPSLNADKQIEFVYDAAERPDKIYNNRAGWPSIIRRRLEKIVVSVDFDKNLAWEQSEAVWAYNLNYILSGDTSRSLIYSIQLEDKDGNTLPAKTFAYQSLEE